MNSDVFDRTSGSAALLVNHLSAVGFSDADIGEILGSVAFYLRQAADVETQHLLRYAPDAKRHAASWLAEIGRRLADEEWTA